MTSAIQRAAAGDVTTEYIVIQADVFHRASCTRTLEQVRRASGSILLDLSHAYVIELEVFDRLADGIGSRISRLGVLLSFEHWASMSGPILMRLASLRSEGLPAQVFYAEQELNGGVREWFASGADRHNLGEVIDARLRDRVPHERNTRLSVLAAIRRLLLDLPAREATPEMFADAAALGIAYASHEDAQHLASEALARLPREPSLVRLRALRVRGTALVANRNLVQGEHDLLAAARTAFALEEPEELASIMSQIGIIALNHDDGRRAAAYFRSALEALPEGGNRFVSRVLDGGGDTLSAPTARAATKQRMHRSA